MKSQRILALTLALALVAHPAALVGQSVDESEGATRWRRWALAGAGALVLGGVATFTDQAGEQARTGVCDQTSCVVVVGSLLGAGLGFLLGSELDSRADRRAREGPTIEVDLSSVNVPEGATRLVDAPAAMYALGRSQVAAVDDGLQTHILTDGFQARAGAVVMDGDLLILASNGQIVGVAVTPATGDVVPLADGGASAMTSVGTDAVAVGEPGRIRRVSIQGSPAAPSVVEEATAAARGLPAAMALGAGQSALWTLEDSALVARNPTSLTEMGHISLPGRGVAVSFSGPLALVSMGNEGVAMVDASDPRSPSIQRVLTNQEFAYDAVELDGRVYVAAGAQGIFVFEAEGDQMRRVGVIRATDFAGDLLVRDGRLYILDRAASKLFRL